MREKPWRPSRLDGLRLVVGRKHLGLVLAPELGGLSGLISRPPERSKMASQEVPGTSVNSPPARRSVTT
jgi:hypothetical protein